MQTKSVVRQVAEVWLIVAAFIGLMMLLVGVKRARGEDAQVIGFSASWCPNCKSPKQQQAWDTLKTKAGAVVYDIDLYPAEAAKWRVSAVPTTLVVSGGQERQRFNGFAQSGDVLSVVHQLAAPARAVPPERSAQQAHMRLGSNLSKGSLLLSLGASKAIGPPVRLITESAESEIRAMLPTTDNDAINELLAAPDLLFYNEQVMPQAYQFQNSFHDPHHNIADPRENDKFGNGNLEFPWRVPGGTENVKGLQAYRFVRFPQKDDGSYWPMVMFDARYPGVQTGEARGAISEHQWMYPRGTVFGELLCMEHGELLYPFELRLRFRESTYWEVDAYRPFPTAAKLSARIKELRPEWTAAPKLASLVEHLDGSQQIVNTRFSDSNPTRRAFSTVGGIDELPPINDDELVAELLTRGKWQSAAGESWKTVRGVEAHAPTVAKGAGFHVVPEQYGAHAFGVDSVSCMHCHEHTGIAVRNFAANRGWYGRIRGSDGIISFHPIDPTAISATKEATQYTLANFVSSYKERGMTLTEILDRQGRLDAFTLTVPGQRAQRVEAPRADDNLPVRYRPDFIAAGIVLDYDPAKCPEDRYQRITMLGVR